MALFNFRSKRDDSGPGPATALTEPRPHHYQFAHEAMPAFAFESAADMLDVMTGPDATEFLELLWQRVGEGFKSRERLPSTGLIHRVWRDDDQIFVIVTLPSALVAGEAWCSALFFDTLHTPPAMRYFVLEFGPGDPPGTVVTEWDAEPTRHNLGPGPVPDAEAFYSYLSALFAPREETGETIEPCLDSVYSVGEDPPKMCALCHHRFEGEELMQSEIELLHNQLICREFEAELTMLRRVRVLFEEYPELDGKLIPAAIRALGAHSTQMQKNLDQGLAYTIVRGASEEAEPLPPGNWTNEQEEVLRFLQTHYFRLGPRTETVTQRTDELLPLLKRRLTCLNCNEGRLYMQPRDY